MIHTQDQVHEELNQIFGDSDRPVSMADLGQMKYLEYCIKEALRLYPSVPFFGRHVTEDVVIGIMLPGQGVCLIKSRSHLLLGS